MIEHYFLLLNNYLQHHAHLGQLFAFLIALAESLPLIGTIVPGSLTMTLVGVFVGRGLLPLDAILLWAFLGAILGDITGFWIGRHYNENLRNIWPFRKHPHWLTLGERFFQKHGGKSIIIGRFVGPARSTVPLIAGLLKLSWYRFFAAAIPSAILWAVAYLLPGVLVGAISLQLPHGKTTEFTLMALGVILVIWLIFWCIQRFFRLIVELINRWIDRLWAWCNYHHSSQWFIRLITNQNNPNDHQQLTLIIFALLSGLLFLFDFYSVLTHHCLYHLNQPVFLFLQSLRNPHADNFFIIITMLGEHDWLFPATLGISAILMLFRYWRAGLHLLAITLLADGAGWFFKHAFYSPRPHGFMTPITSSSFPSGHAILSVAVLGFIVVLSAQIVRYGWRWIVYITGGCIIFSIVLSRIYLGAHWLTDIIGGITLGAFILSVTVVHYRRNITKKLNPYVWFPLLAISLMIPWTIQARHDYDALKYGFTRYWPERTIELQDWWQNPTSYLPLYRLNRFGSPVQPFNLQWASDLDTIEQRLTAQGWLIFSVKNKLQSTLQYSMPLMLPLYHNQAPTLTMIKPLSDRDRVILRLWKTSIVLFKQNKILWIGSINYQRGHHIDMTQNSGIGAVIPALHGLHKKEIQVNDNQQPRQIRRLGWNGMILIVK